MNAAIHPWHTLYMGYLNDWPGRDEHWVESLRYRGNNRWTWRLESLRPAQTPVYERLSTRRLIARMMDEDANIDEPWVTCEGEDSDNTASLGPRGEALLVIAEEEGATYCVKCLKGWLNGTWPPRSKPVFVRVLSIVGPAKRPVWRGIDHHGLLVETNRGPAFLYPEHQDGLTRVVFPPIEGPNAATYATQLSRELIAALDRITRSDSFAVATWATSNKEGD